MLQLLLPLELDLLLTVNFVESRDDVILELVGGYVVVHRLDSVECIGSNGEYSTKPTPLSCNIEVPPIRCKASGLVIQEESVSISKYHNTIDLTNTHINASAAIQAVKIRAVNTHRTTLQTKRQLLQMYKR